MSWTVILHEQFETEFDELSKEIQDEMLAEAGFLELLGPQTGRPHVDTLKNSKYTNMKELRFEAADGEWRVAFAFDPMRRAILLVAGDKTGGSQKKFYKRLVVEADRRYGLHLHKLKGATQISDERATSVAAKYGNSGKDKKR